MIKQSSFYDSFRIFLVYFIRQDFQEKCKWILQNSLLCPFVDRKNVLFHFYAGNILSAKRLGNVMTSKIETAHGNFCKTSKKHFNVKEVVYGVGNKVWQKGQKRKGKRNLFLGHM